MPRVLTAVAVLVLLAAIALLVWVGAGRSGGGPPAPVELRERALEAIREEIARAEPVQTRTDAERMADALAWIGEHRPDGWPYTGLEARVLAHFEGMGEAGTRSAAWALEASRIEVEMVRAIDADGDGLVSDEEVEAFAGVLRSLDDLRTHPYMVARFDTDGDGVVSDTEASWLGTDAQIRQMQGLTERARVDRWDTDGDGVLSEQERVSGREASLLHSKMFEDGHIEYVEEPGENAAAEHEAMYARLVEMWGEDVAQMTLERRERSAEINLSAELSRAARLLERDALAQDQAQPSPQPPDVAAFDTDGDGVLDDDTGYAAAVAAYQRDFEEWSVRSRARGLRAAFEAAAAAGDANGDGVLTPEEWDRRVIELVDDRAERLYLMHYDTDGNGRVGPTEVEDFLAWYRADSLRADVNYDGTVDSRDLREMIVRFEGQGG